jgi:cytochrome c-type biogenesis protein CcmH
MRHLMRTLAAAVILVHLASPHLAAQSPAQSSQGRAQTIAGTLMSPYCLGRLLSECQSQGAFDLRDEIAKRLEAGESETIIIADLATRYGDGIRGFPAPRGFGLLAWMTPALLAVMTLAVLVVGIRRTSLRRRGAVAQPPEGGRTEDPVTAARLDDELAALD